VPKYLLYVTFVVNINSNVTLTTHGNDLFCYNDIHWHAKCLSLRIALCTAKLTMATLFCLGSLAHSSVSSSQLSTLCSPYLVGADVWENHSATGRVKLLSCLIKFNTALCACISLHPYMASQYFKHAYLTSQYNWQAMSQDVNVYNLVIPWSYLLLPFVV